MRTLFKLFLGSFSALICFSALAQAPAGVPQQYRRNFEPQEQEAYDQSQYQASPAAPYQEIPQAAATIEGSCADRCTCAYELGMGGAYFGMLFGTYKNEYGELSFPRFTFGGRGFTYFLEGQLRVGGMGAMVFSTENSDEPISPITANMDDGTISKFDESKGRLLAAGYGGVTVEYVLAIGDYIRFPMGVLVGFGGGGFTSTMREEADKTIYTMATQGGMFIALQPMAEVQAVITDRFAISLGGTYLWAEAFGDAGNFGGPGFFLSIEGGRFRPLKL